MLSVGKSAQEVSAFLSFSLKRENYSFFKKSSTQAFL